VKRDVADAVDVGDGRTAEFHNETAHDEWCIPWRQWVKIPRTNARKREARISQQRGRGQATPVL
jgi:hypothetical protein